MTIIVERAEPDVVRIRMSSWRGRAVGYDVSAFLLRGVLVDTGFPGARDELLAAVLPLAPRGVVVTHWHEDHAGNAAALAALGVPVRMHPRCEATLRTQPAIRLYRRVVWSQAPRLEAPLVSFDPAPLLVIDTPGHSGDHQVVWDPERRILASGDLFLGVKVRVAHLHEMPSLVLQSLRRVIALQPRILLDAHRGVVANATEMLQAKVDWMEGTIEQIETLAREGAGEREIAQRVLGREAFVGWVSGFEYSKRAFVRGVLREAWSNAPVPY